MPQLGEATDRPFQLSLNRFSTFIISNIVAQELNHYPLISDPHNLHANPPNSFTYSTTTMERSACFTPSLEASVAQYLGFSHRPKYPDYAHYLHWKTSVPPTMEQPSTYVQSHMFLILTIRSCLVRDYVLAFAFEDIRTYPSPSPPIVCLGKVHFNHSFLLGDRRCTGCSNHSLSSHAGAENLQ